MNEKPEPLAKEKARKKRNGMADRRVCTDAVWRRAGNGFSGHCECDGCPNCLTPGRECGRFVKRGGTFFKALGHVDEKVPRSRGGDPHDPDNCLLKCYDCHFSGPSGAHRITRRDDP